MNLGCGCTSGGKWSGEVRAALAQPSERRTEQAQDAPRGNLCSAPGYSSESQSSRAVSAIQALAEMPRPDSVRVGQLSALKQHLTLLEKRPRSHTGTYLYLHSCCSYPEVEKKSRGVGTVGLFTSVKSGPSVTRGAHMFYHSVLPEAFFSCCRVFLIFLIFALVLLNSFANSAVYVRSLEHTSAVRWHCPSPHTCSLPLASCQGSQSSDAPSRAPGLTVPVPLPGQPPEELEELSVF